MTKGRTAWWRRSESGRKAADWWQRARSHQALSHLATAPFAWWPSDPVTLPPGTYRIAALYTADTDAWAFGSLGEFFGLKFEPGVTEVSGRYAYGAELTYPNRSNWEFYSGGNAFLQAVDSAEKIRASRFRLVLGRRIGGGVANMAEIDGKFISVCRFFVPNLVVPPIEVEVEATGVEDPGELAFTATGKAVNSGNYQLWVEMYDWQLERYDTTTLSRVPLSSGLRTAISEGIGNLNRFLRDPSSRNYTMRARWRVSQSGPSSVQLWCVDVDAVAWYVRRNRVAW